MAAYNLRSQIRHENDIDHEHKEKIRYGNDSMLNIRKIYW